MTRMIQASRISDNNRWTFVLSVYGIADWKIGLYSWALVFIERDLFIPYMALPAGRHGLYSRTLIGIAGCKTDLYDRSLVYYLYEILG